MKVFLTGGAGFIGANLAHYWRIVHPGDDLVVYDALTYAGRRESLADLEGHPGFDFVLGDILDPERLRSSLAGVDLVIHLAAESHNDRAIEDPLPFVRTNVLGTAVLLEACRRADIPRFHHVSTDEVYGSLELESPDRFTEATAYDPRGPYSASKAGSDHLVRAWCRTYGVRATLSNCGNNFGPFQSPEKLVPLTITRALGNGEIPVYGDGRNVRDWIYVEDHCSALDRIVARGRPGETYVISASNEKSNLEVVRTIVREVGRGEERIRLVKDRLGHDRRYALDAGKLAHELGWAPRHEFLAALRSTIDWYRTNSGWWSSGPAAGSEVRT